MDLSLIEFDEDGRGGTKQADVTGEYFYVKSGSLRQAKDGYTDTDNAMLKMIINSMNRDFGNAVSQAESDPTVDACISGKTFQMIGGGDRTANGDAYSKRYAENKGSRDTRRFQNLMHTAHMSISNHILSSILSSYNKELLTMTESGKQDDMYDAIMKRYQKIIMREMAGKEPCDMTAEEYDLLLANEELVNTMKQQQDVYNDQKCTSEAVHPEWNFDAHFSSRVSGDTSWWKLLLLDIFDPNGIFQFNRDLDTAKSSTEYDPETNNCVQTVTVYKCKTTGKRSGDNYCKEWDMENTQTQEIKHIMPEWNSPGAEAFCSK